MRISHAFMALTLVSGALVASDPQEDFRWAQVQGGVTDHKTDNPDHQQPAIGFGIGTWINGNFGLEASGLGTYVNYGGGKAKEAHATASVLINPFRTTHAFRPFLRLGAGSTTIGSPPPSRCAKQNSRATPFLVWSVKNTRSMPETYTGARRPARGLI